MRLLPTLRWALVLAVTYVVSAIAQPTPSALIANDGTNHLQYMRADRNSDGSLATHNVPEVGGAAVSGSNPLPVAVAPGVSSYQGVITIPPATSTALISANVTMAQGPNGSTSVLPSPGGFGSLNVVNTGSNDLLVCWFGGVASQSSPCELLHPGAGDGRNLTGSVNAPTLYSQLGTSMSFGN